MVSLMMRVGESGVAVCLRMAWCADGGWGFFDWSRKFGRGRKDDVSSIDFGYQEWGFRQLPSRLLNFLFLVVVMNDDDAKI